jgi:DNA-binding transcriptional MerR regulator
MNELVTINKVSSSLGISSRTLRYWESAGLFRSIRDAQSGWRMYDYYALQCIQITDLLRRLDFSIKDIKEVMERKTVGSLCDVLKKQLRRLDNARTDLDERKEAISELIMMLEAESSLTLYSLENILVPVALERKKYVVSKLKGGFSMKNVKSKFDEVLYVNMAPARAVAFNAVSSQDPEDKAYIPVKEWIDKNNLQGTARIFLFNVEPYPSEDNPEYGMGCCATIPEGVKIPEQLYEMRLPGGTYAVISEYEGDPSYGWKKIQALLDDKDWEWEYDEGRYPGLEEHIEREGGGFHIPILFPVRKNR